MKASELKMEPGELSLQVYGCWWWGLVGRGQEPHLGAWEEYPQHHRASVSRQIPPPLGSSCAHGEFTLLCVPKIIMFL